MDIAEVERFRREKLGALADDGESITGAGGISPQEMRAIALVKGKQQQQVRLEEKEDEDNNDDDNLPNHHNIKEGSHNGPDDDTCAIVVVETTESIGLTQLNSRLTKS